MSLVRRNRLRASSLVMALAIWPLRAHSIVAILPVATLVYVGVGMLVGAVPPDDIKAVYSAIRRKGDEGTAPEPWTPPDVMPARAAAASVMNKCFADQKARQRGRIDRQFRSAETANASRPDPSSRLT